MDTLRAKLSPTPVRRPDALARMEQISSITHLVASLEYLARPRDRRRGGLNHWEVSGRPFHARSRHLGRVLDVLADRRVTTALHLLRVPAALSLQARLGRRARLAADAFLSGTSLALYPRHHYGTDGSDQVSFLVQSVATLARVGERRPKLVDACLWYVALQAVLSYTASGWAKLAGSSWRTGDALAGVTRTLTYGDPTAFRLFNRFPRVARALSTQVLVMECLFPAAFLFRGRLAAPMLASAAFFHVANARIMGLGRFVWSFTSMHPAVLYCAGPRERRIGRRHVERRDDTLPQVCAGMIAAALAATLAGQARRRSVVLHGRGDERTLTTRSGNTLTYRRTGPEGGDEPVVVLESGLLSTAEHWEWIARELAQRYPTVTYNRAGYGPSRYAGNGSYRLDTAVDDLVDLTRHVTDGGRAVLVGHSLGGLIALRAAAAAPELVSAACLLDSSHPGELQRSSRQAQGQQVFTRSLSLMPASLSLGLGALLKRPEWVDTLPEDVRELVLAEYRDPRLWAAGRREWRATLAEFEAFDGELPEINVPLLVLTAGLTARNDAVQKELHDELAAAAPRSDQHVIDGADHDQVLTHPKAAGRVADRIAGFLEEVTDRAKAAT